MKRASFFSTLSLAAICLLLVSFTISTNADVVKLGDKVPDFTLTGMDGVEHHLYEYEGNVIFFNIFGVT
ncbi:hypothetical protein KKB18_01250 [bacterium]|nr:hypothetical protein [bacterium]